MVAALFEHLGKLRPTLRRRMLAAEFALAMAPAAVRDHGGDARIGAAGIDADRAAKARADYPYAIRIAGVMQVGLSLLEPKPCSTRNAARRSPGRTPSGTLTTPCRRKPAD